MQKNTGNNQQQIDLQISKLSMQKNKGNNKTDWFTDVQVEHAENTGNNK